jgi:hypothetical protein
VNIESAGASKGGCAGRFSHPQDVFEKTFRDALNLSVRCTDSFTGRGHKTHLREPVMPKAARVPSSISEPRIYTEKSAIPAKQSDSHQLVAVALFSGIGLLISLVAVILGVQGLWF